MRFSVLVLVLVAFVQGCASTPYFYKWGGKGEVHWDGRTSWCVPRRLKKVLRRTAHHYGDVHVHSSYRSRRHNRRIGGAKKSWHRKCKAVDFSVRGAPMGEVYGFVRSQKEVGGRKLYPGGRHIHIDTGPKRSW